jgi:2-oxoglutarate ferredoxin oxidoreductase subunit delta
MKRVTKVSVIRIDIDKYLCKGCYICVDKCPTKVFEVSDIVGDYGVFIPQAKHLDKCIGCEICELYCPDFAITIVRGDDDEV